MLELVDGADLRFAIFLCKGSSPFVGILHDYLKLVLINYDENIYSVFT